MDEAAVRAASPSARVGGAVTLGTVLGVAMGVTINNIALGIGIGLALGLAFRRPRPRRGLTAGPDSVGSQSVDSVKSRCARR